MKDVFGLQLPVVTAEDLIALKLQARKNNPDRIQDTADIERLFEYNRDRLDIEYMRQFFRLFECEEYLDELLKRF